MELERLQDLSVKYWLEDVVYPDISSFLTVVDGFPNELLSLPTIAVEWEDIRVRPQELGNRYGIDLRLWIIDIFAKNKSQRDDYSFRLKRYLANTIPVYNYVEGFPPEVTPSQIGYLSAEQLRLKRIKILPELVGENLYYRSNVSFVGTYTSIV